MYVPQNITQKDIVAAANSVSQALCATWELLPAEHPTKSFRRARCTAVTADAGSLVQCMNNSGYLVSPEGLTCCLHPDVNCWNQQEGPG